MATARSLLSRFRTTVVDPVDTPGPIACAVEQLLQQAIDRQASDLHVDPDGDGSRIRLRVDGLFEQGPVLDRGLQSRLIARLKVLAGLAVYRTGEIQEGSIRTEHGVELRLSIVPTIRGEKATLRIFDPRVRPFRIDELGFRPDIERAVTDLSDRGHGTVLVAGPAGAGKTTTLYALLSRIAEARGDSQNICSVEDPVEFALPGVHQVPVRRESGVTFARSLSALLRQDPGVLLVGEVRDPETASIAIEAGMTGHLVLSSIHAGRASEALTRLVDLGVEPFLVASSVRGVIAQRLVRQLCAQCVVPDEGVTGLLERFEIVGPGEWIRGEGCDHCRGSGFRGRIPLVELIEVNRDVARAIRDRAGTRATEHLLGGRTLLSEGISHARVGRTTLGEIARVIGKEALGDA